MSVLLFYNPYSGKNRFNNIKTVVDSVISQLEASGVQVTPTTDIPASFEPYSLVVVIGGDGTINRVIQTLPSTIPLGIIPYGSANVLAKHLHLPFAIQDAISCILKGKTRPIDVGSINTYRFVCMAGFGLDASVIQITDMHLKKTFGRTGYVLGALWILFTQSLSTHQITIRDLVSDQRHEGYFAIIANCPLYGGKFLLSKSCLDDDCQLDVFLLKKPSKLSLVCGIFYLLFSSLDRYKGFEKLSIKQGSIISHKSYFHVDAELRPLTSAYIRVKSKALKVIIP